MLSLNEFHSSAQRLDKKGDIKEHLHKSGLVNAPDVRAVHCYDGDFIIFELQDSYLLPSANKVWVNKEIYPLVGILYSIYCTETLETREDMILMSQAMMALEWGEEDQVEVENSFFQLAESKFNFDLNNDRWVVYALKANTQELADYILQRI